MIHALSPSGVRQIVLNVAQHSKKAQQPTTGHPMANCIVFPVENQSIGSFYQPQLMKKFTRVLAILSPADQ